MLIIAGGKRHGRYTGFVVDNFDIGLVDLNKGIHKVVSYIWFYWSRGLQTTG